MVPLRRFARLSSSDWFLLAHAGLVVVVVRLSLWACPWRSLLRVVQSTRPRRRARPQEDAPRLAWAIRHSSRLVPAATCLTQALALHYLLLRAGFPSRIEIGVAADGERGLRAHAWVESCEHVLMGGGELDSFTRLVTVRGDS